MRPDEKPLISVSILQVEALYTDTGYFFAISLPSPPRAGVTQIRENISLTMTAKVPIRVLGFCLCVFLCAAGDA
jgi:hypothetical protein